MSDHFEYSLREHIKSRLESKIDDREGMSSYDAGFEDGYRQALLLIRSKFLSESPKTEVHSDENCAFCYCPTPAICSISACQLPLKAD